MSLITNSLRLMVVVQLALMLQAPSTFAAENESVCGIFGLEGAMFNAWRSLANQGPASPQLGGYDYHPLSLETRDGQTLAGYRVSKKSIQTAQSMLLFIQGNAMRAEQLFGALPIFADRGYDVFIFNFRGYGKSTGKPFLKPISLDLLQITQFLGSQNYQHMYLYGISIGGIFALGPHMDLRPFDRIAIDSTPSELPWYSSCPAKYDPVNNLQKYASKILVISGGRENVVSASAVRELGETVKKNGGRHVHEPKFGHPFMDSGENTIKRFNTVLDFFSKSN